jgi:hypothetical protein
MERWMKKHVILSIFALFAFSPLMGLEAQLKDLETSPFFKRFGEANPY